MTNVAGILLLCFFICINLSQQGKHHKTREIVEDQSYWNNLGRDDIINALKVEKNNNKAKNVILFIGDGMGLSTITASRIYGKTEKGYLVFEKFPNTGLLKTYSANKLVPDSCSTATAIFSGVKANQKTSGVDATVNVDDCEASLKPDSHLDSIVKWGQDANKATGFVTTTRVTHATPSALYAHTPNRNWECEAKIPSESAECKDIARQLIEDSPGKFINVIMGGGRQCLQSNVSGSEADPIDTWSCYSKDNRDLIQDWKDEKISRGVSHAVVQNNQDLSNLKDEDYVLGIFANGHMKMEHDRDNSPTGAPSLSEMTETAINILKKNDDGFILMVEGGMIDFAHHRGHARQALNEVVAFDAAIEQALEMVDLEETLIIVTSDHSHSLIISGYSDRGIPITGIAGASKIDHMSYTTLLYGTGSQDNYKYYVQDNSVMREDPSTVNTHSFDYSQQAAVLTDEVTHEGTDVAVFAQGPMAHLFHSVHEQTYVAYVIAYAAEIGPYSKKLGRSSSNTIIPSINILTSLVLCIVIIFK